MANYDFVQNKACEYFPCHQCADPESFSCLFCYCPLYALGDQCGGNFRYTESGIKDCSGCLRPHRRENYEKILEKMPLAMELAKKNRENP
jgi:Zn-finger protein